MVDDFVRDKPTGFRGLGALLSDIGDEPSLRPASAHHQESPSDRTAAVEASNGSAVPGTAPPLGKRSRWKWSGAAIIFIAGFFWWQFEQRPSPKPYQPPSVSNSMGSPAAPDSPASYPAGAQKLESRPPEIAAPAANLATPSTPPAKSAPAAQTKPEPPWEEMPPVGTHLVLTAPQIRYCLAQDIRLDSVRAGVDAYSDAQVDRFNAMVDDYNTRCGSFRYHPATLELAQKEIASRRSALQREGASILKQWRDEASQKTRSEVTRSGKKSMGQSNTSPIRP